MICITGWWFGTFLIFPYIGNFIIPTDEVIFFRGVGLNHQPDNIVERIIALVGLAPGAMFKGFSSSDVSGQNQAGVYGCLAWSGRSKWENMVIFHSYPLVNVYITMERSTIL